jgi:hypothetical protein
MVKDHDCLFVEEQQTGHRYCAMCGKHDPPVANCPDRESALWTFLSTGHPRRKTRACDSFRRGLLEERRNT